VLHVLKKKDLYKNENDKNNTKWKPERSPIKAIEHIAD
jgi:hypothetical protein